ncbi:MAG: RNA polymerase sigma factor [Gemmatimonadaceae bacterium]|nr:RNA polymerase sigma factor [Chitinophagaceae bacterium]
MHAFLSDETLINRAMAGDQAAWQSLFQRHYPMAISTALQFCKDLDKAKDAVQEGFITAFLKLDQLKQKDSFAPWLSMIVRRQALKLITTNEVRTMTSTTVENSIEKAFDDFEIRAKLSSALDGLSEPLRVVVMLRYFSNYKSYSSIADILAIPEGTVKSRLAEAKRKLFHDWQQKGTVNDSAERVARNWTNFYESKFENLHRNPDSLNNLVAHMKKDITLVYPGNKIRHGTDPFSNMVFDDLNSGSWLTPVQVSTAGNLTVVESAHFNSDKYPGHCPDRSVLLIWRQKNEASRISFHLFK